ncbi:hypothetical protein H4R18_004263 [Coemansia javaensis]|uniref:Pre-mRNA-processing factor 19 n=1 Tax=Coemansia javaensis TaxID=2761396 RepID=A0A9W8H865_9FUNG|nr:hypothetical protein H4R18_004263 [Coemansia javaensis]
MQCALSGEAPTEPVVSSKTGRVYERRLLQKYLDETGKEPQADHGLGADDIIAVTSDPPVVRPRPPTLTSIPALLSTFQDEWDALVLETFTLKQQYQQARQELSQALYQNDAACRVAARLMKERDEARAMLASLQAQLGANSNSAQPAHAAASDMEVDANNNGNAPEDTYHAKAAETAAVLSKARMKREAPADLVSADAWKTAVQSAAIESLHTTTKPGIISLDLDRSGDLVLTGGMDNHAEVYSSARDQTLATIKGHTKKVTAVAWINGGGLDQRIVTGSADKSVRVWSPKAGNAEEGKDARHIGWTKDCIIKHHAAEIAGVAVHPCGEYFVSAAVDGSWAIHTLAGETIIQDSIESPITQVAFHPDGMFLGIGTRDGYAKIVDVKQKQTLATLDVASAHGDGAAVGSLHFSENGYYFATVSAGEAAVWDLRKQKKAHSWTVADLAPEAAGDAAPTFAAARFDASGKYLVLVAGSIYVIKVKGWGLLATLPAGESATTAIAWCGPISASIVAASLDNTLRYYAPAQS